MTQPNNEIPNYNYINEEGCCAECQPKPQPVVPQPIATDCNNQCCSGLVPVAPSSLENLRTALMKVERVFDCVNQSTIPQFRNVNLRFDVDPRFFGPLHPGDKVCITKIGLGYDCIGLGTTIPAKINSKDVTFTKRGPALCECLQKPSGTYTLYNKFEAEINNPLYCCEEPTQSGVQVTVYEHDLDFYVCGLKIVVECIIECNKKPFTVEYIYNGKLSDLGGTGLGIKPLDFYEKVCIPTDKKKVELHEVFTVDTFYTNCAKATTDIVETGSGFKKDYYFDADVLLCFAMNKEINTTIRETLAVAFDPKTTIGCTPVPYPCDPCQD